MNRAVIMGRLTAQPELRSTQNGIAVVSGTVAVNRPFKDKTTGEYQADFINVVAWRQTAEFIAKHFGKGAMIALEGRIQTRNYDDKDGVRRYVTEIVADQVYFTGEKHDDNNTNDRQNSHAGEQEAHSGTQDDFDDLSDDDLPF